MSYLSVAPEFVASAATDLSNVGSALGAAHAVAATPTTAVIAAAQDEVSAAVASVFSGHGQAFQTLSAKAAEFHSQFVSVLRGGAGTYLHAEAANASALSHQLGITHTATAASGSATSGFVTLGPGSYGQGVYADGRVMVEPGSRIQVDPGSKLSVAPESLVFVGPSGTNGGFIAIQAGSTLSVGSKSAIFINGGALRMSSNVTFPRGGLLTIGNNSSFGLVHPVTIDHSEVIITPNTVFDNGAYGSALTISQGNITGSYSAVDLKPANRFYSLFGVPDRDLVVITKYPFDGTPSVRIR